MSCGSNELAMIRRHRHFRTILEQDTAFFRIEQRVFPSAFPAQPKVLDGMRVRRFLAQAISFMKPEELPLTIVKGNLAGGICT